MHHWWLPLVLGGWLLTAGFAGSAKANFVDASNVIVNGCIFLVAPSLGLVQFLMVCLGFLARPCGSNNNTKGYRCF
jgi:hypothetical protein